MTPNHLKGEIDRLSLQLLEANLALTYNPAGCITHKNELTVTWNSQQTGVALTDSVSGTINEYMNMLAGQCYSVVLFDGSLLQISYTFRHNDIIKHPLGYYPCPFVIDMEEVQEFGLTELVESYDPLNYRDFVRLQSPLRFDLDLDQAAVNHPASHLHISSSSCRIPVFAPISIGHFVTFVFQHFYVERWDAHDFIKGWAKHRFARCLDTRQLTSFYFDCVT